MRATIDTTGRLTVIPESEVEAYALQCYAEKFNSDTPPEIRFGFEEIHPPGGGNAPKESEKRSLTPQEWMRMMRMERLAEAHGANQSEAKP